MMRYVVGFVFTSNLSEVLLMHKNRPKWQAGKINGPGGKLDEGEDPHAGIKREIFEESNLSIDTWTYAGRIYSKEFEVHFLCATYENKNDAKSMEDEPVEWFKTESLPENLIPNLKWLIPLCADKIRDSSLLEFSVLYE